MAFDPSQLLPTVGTSLAFYDELGLGNYGSFSVTDAQDGTLVSFALDSSAVTDINTDIANQAPFFWVGGTDNGPTPLAVPEPSTLVLLGPGFLALAFIRRRRTLKLARLSS